MARFPGLNSEPQNIEYRISKEGIWSILSKKIERNDSTLRQSSFAFLEVLFRFDRPFFWPAAGLNPERLSNFVPLWLFFI
jgi:hypothetical protein